LQISTAVFPSLPKARIELLTSFETSIPLCSIKEGFPARTFSPFIIPITPLPGIA